MYICVNLPFRDLNPGLYTPPPLLNLTKTCTYGVTILIRGGIGLFFLKKEKTLSTSIIQYSLIMLLK